MDSNAPHILLVDDEAFIRHALELYFETHGFRVSTAQDGDAALETFRAPEKLLDVVILDLLMPGTHGLDVLRELKSIDPLVEVIIATGCGSMNHAVEALRHGAFDFITKPILNFDEDLLKTVEKALAARTKKLAETKVPEVELRPVATPLPIPPPNPSSENGVGWGAVYRRMERLAREHGDREVDQSTADAVWNVLNEGLGADAALFIQQDDEEWQCLYSWGFSAPPTARDLWQTRPDADEPERDASERDGRVGVDGPRRDMVPRWDMKWSRVLHVPFCGAGGGHLVLLLFYRDESVLDLEESPLSLLAAVLSWVFRRPNGVTMPEIVRLSETTSASPGDGSSTTSPVS